MQLKRYFTGVLMGATSLLLVACTATHYDPSPAADAQPQVTQYNSPLTMEDSYRRLYDRLSGCLSGFYHVQPRFDAEQSSASVLIVEGLGFNRYSVLGNSFVARFDVVPSAGGSRVSVTNVNEGLQPLIKTTQGWLAGNVQGCG